MNTQINKALILPILALVALLLKQVFHYELSQPEMDVIADGVLAIVALVGIFMHPHQTPPVDPPSDK